MKVSKIFFLLVLIPLLGAGVISAADKDPKDDKPSGWNFFNKKSAEKKKQQTHPASSPSLFGPDTARRNPRDPLPPVPPANSNFSGMSVSDLPGFDTCANPNLHVNWKTGQVIVPPPRSRASLAGVDQQSSTSQQDVRPLSVASGRSSGNLDSRPMSSSSGRNSAGLSWMMSAFPIDSLHPRASSSEVTANFSASPQSQAVSRTSSVPLVPLHPRAVRVISGCAMIDDNEDDLDIDAFEVSMCLPPMQRLGVDYRSATNDDDQSAHERIYSVCSEEQPIYTDLFSVRQSVLEIYREVTLQYCTRDGDVKRLIKKIDPLLKYAAANDCICRGSLDDALDAFSLLCQAGCPSGGDVLHFNRSLIVTFVFENQIRWQLFDRVMRALKDATITLDDIVMIQPYVDALYQNAQVVENHIAMRTDTAVFAEYLDANSVVDFSARMKILSSILLKLRLAMEDAIRIEQKRISQLSANVTSLAEEKRRERRPDAK